MSHHTHEHHNLDNEEFQTNGRSFGLEKRKQQLSAEAIISYLPELKGKRF